MPAFLDEFPFLMPTVRTAVTIAVTYLVGRVAFLVAGRLARAALTTHGNWDDIVIGAVSKRIPLWSLVAGAWLSLGYWPLGDRWVRMTSVLLSTVWLGSVTFAVSAITTRLVVAFGERVPGVTVSGLAQNVVRMLVLSFGALAILNGFGIEIRPMLAALGVGGLAVALGLQEPLSNLFAGVFVSMSRQVRIGDFVRLDSGVEGRVADFNWRYTSLALLSGSTAMVPNAKLSQAIVTNFNLPTTEMNVSVDFVVDYASDAEEVEVVALEVARGVLTSVEGAVADFEPLVRFNAFGDVGLRGMVVLRAHTFGDHPAVRHAFVSRLHKAFKERGIVVPTKR